MYFVKTPPILKKTLPKALWDLHSDKAEVYLTFDDGPEPTVTPFVLDELAKYNAKGTFFCVGANVKDEPGIYQRIQDEGHTVGNHTFTHLNGWKNKNKVYLEDVAQCAEYMDTPLFRPPYGRLKRKSYKALNKEYKIVMWDVLSGDFDTGIDGEQCATNVLSNVANGSIVVFHDSLKAEERLRVALPKVLQEMSDRGMEMKALPTDQ